MSDKEKLQEMLDKYKRYYLYHDFSAQFNEGDIEWLLNQVEKMTEEIEILNGALDLKAQEFVIERNKAVRYKGALKEIITIEDENGSVGYLLDKAIRIAKQAVEVKMNEEVKQNIDTANYSRMIDYIETLEQAYSKKVKLLNQLEEENKKLKRQLSLLCPIADLPVIDSLLIQKEMYMEHVEKLSNLLKKLYKASKKLDVEYCTYLNRGEHDLSAHEYEEIVDVFIEVEEYLKEIE